MNKKRLYILFMSACLMMTHAYAQQISFGPLHSLEDSGVPPFSLAKAAACL